MEVSKDLGQTDFRGYWSCWGRTQTMVAVERENDGFLREHIADYDEFESLLLSWSALGRAFLRQIVVLSLWRNASVLSNQIWILSKNVELRAKILCYCAFLEIPATINNAKYGCTLFVWNSSILQYKFPLQHIWQLLCWLAASCSMVVGDLRLVCSLFDECLKLIMCTSFSDLTSFVAYILQKLMTA